LLDFSAAREAFLKQQDHHPDPAALWYLAALTAPVDRAAALSYLADIPSAPDAPAGQDQTRRPVPPETEVAAWRDYLVNTLNLLPAGASQAEIAKASGIALAQARLWPLAINALTVARESAPGEDAETLAFLGHALGQMDRPALELLEQAHQVDPNSALPLYFQGLYLREQGALQAAEALFRQAIRLEPENPAFYAELAQTKAGQADLSAAENWYIRAVEAAGEDTRFQLMLAEFYSEYGYRLAEAGIPTVQAVLEVEPDNALALTILGWMQFQSGSPADAAVSLRQALEIDPGLITARYRLARALETLGQATQAAAEYRRVVDLDTSGIYRDRALVDLQRLSQASGFSG
jgi:tetratricopeptide (TPR) repeat protein